MSQVDQMPQWGGSPPADDAKASDKTMSTTGSYEFSLSDAAIDESPPEKNRTLLGGGLVIAAIALAAVVIPMLMINAKRDQIVQDTSTRLAILSAGRAQVLETWLEGTVRLADRAVESELLRLFATEVDLSGGDLSGALGDSNADASLVAQLPLIERVITDFAIDAKFDSTYLFNQRGDPYAVSAGAPAAGTELKAVATGVFAEGMPVFGPARQSASGLVMDIGLPIFPVQQEPGTTPPAAAFLITLPVAQPLSDALAPHPLAEAGERARLVQFHNGSYEEVLLGQPQLLRSAGEVSPNDSGDSIPFQERENPDDGTAVYLAGTKVPGPTWWVIQEIDKAAAHRKVTGFATASIVIAIMAVLVVAVAFGAFWWRLSNEHNHALAEQFRRLAARIESQKRLLDSINNSITDYIGLKDSDGHYRYVNPAFAAAVQRTPEEVVGMDDASLFGQGTAERLEVSDHRAKASDAPVTTSEEVYLDTRLHHLQISKVPYHDDSGAVSGLVSVTRDVTELVEQQQKKERAIQQMVQALVQAIEMRDPYLGGHSRRVAGFAVAVGKRLNASAEDITTLELAANLSQIGKLAIPSHLLTKTERLTESEIEQMRGHLNHAAELLRDIDFELPVLETLLEMNERLDGGGYPAGLKGDQISLCGKILGVCDVFCARVEPRSYRQGISAEEALDILAENAARYDSEVIEALREVAGSVSGEKLIASIRGH